MKIVIPGGTGQVGTVLARSFHSRGLLEQGFGFEYPQWPAAAGELCARWVGAREGEKGRR